MRVAGTAAVVKAAKDAGFDVTVPFTGGRGDATAEQTDAESFEPLSGTLITEAGNANDRHIVSPGRIQSLPEHGGHVQPHLAPGSEHCNRACESPCRPGRRRRRR